MDKEEYLAFHKFYFELADHLDAELEETEYDEYGTYPVSVHKEVGGHKEAIRLLSGVLEEETDLTITGLESWHEGHENSNEQEYSLRDNPVGK